MISWLMDRWDEQLSDFSLFYYFHALPNDVSAENKNQTVLEQTHAGALLVRKHENSVTLHLQTEQVH